MGSVKQDRDRQGSLENGASDAGARWLEAGGWCKQGIKAAAHAVHAVHGRRLGVQERPCQTVFLPCGKQCGPGVVRVGYKVGWGGAGWVPAGCIHVVVQVGGSEVAGRENVGRGRLRGRPEVVWVRRGTSKACQPVVAVWRL